MIQFAEQDLFASGPATVWEEGLSLRQDSVSAAVGPGRLIAGQRESRRLTQTGELWGDRVTDLVAQTQAVDTWLDGRAYTLDAGDGRLWSGVVMTKFVPEVPERVGTRYRVRYTVGYVQADAEGVS